MKKKLLAMLMTFSMVMSLLPAAVFAEEASNTTEGSVPTVGGSLTTGANPSTVYYGGIPWLVLDKEFSDGQADPTNGLYLLSKYAYGYGTFWNAHYGPGDYVWHRTGIFTRLDVLYHPEGYNGDPGNTSPTNLGYQASDIRKYMTGIGDYEAVYPRSMHEHGNPDNSGLNVSSYFWKTKVTDTEPTSGVEYYVKGEFKLSNCEFNNYETLAVTAHDWLPDTWYTYDAETGEFNLVEEAPAAGETLTCYHDATEYYKVGELDSFEEGVDYYTFEKISAGMPEWEYTKLEMQANSIAKGALYVAFTVTDMKESTSADPEGEGRVILSGENNRSFASDMGFSKLEQEAVLPTSRKGATNGGAKAPSLWTYKNSGAYSDELVNDTYFLPSAADLNTYLDDNGISKAATYANGDSAQYWLSSMLRYDRVGMTDGGGGEWYQHPTFKSLGIRPAFNLNPDAVLFYAPVNDAAFGAVSNNEDNAYKLVLKDEDRDDFFVGIAYEGNTARINYYNATIGDNEYISAVVVDEGNNIVAYGQVAKVTGANGEATLDLTGIDMIGKTLYIFNEQCNGAGETNYASELQVGKSAAIDSTPYATPYDSLADAIAAAQSGDTLTLLDDVALTTTFAIPAEMTLTIDGNGHKITPAYGFTADGNGAALVLANGDTGYSANSKYTIKNLTFEGFTGLTRVVRANFCDAKIDNCFFLDNTVSEGVITSAHAKLTVNGCAFTDNTITDYAAIYVGGDVSTYTTHVANITGNSFTQNKAGVAVIYLTSSANVTGNYFYGNTHTGSNPNGATILAGPYNDEKEEGAYTINIMENAFVGTFVGTMGGKPAVYAEDWSAEYNANTAFDLSANYWNGEKPVEGVAYATSGSNPAIKLDSYYTTISEGTGELGDLKTHYLVTFDANGGTCGTASAYTDELSELPTATRSGYTFNGWYTAATGGTKVTSVSSIESDDTLYAQWNLIPVYDDSGGGSTPPTVTVPVSSDSGSANVSASISGTAVTVSITDQDLSQVIASAGNTGNVVIDVSGLNNVTSAVIPSKVITADNGAEDATGLTVALPGGSVGLDSDALAAVAAAAGGADVTMSVETVDTSKLGESQQAVLGNQISNAIVVDVSIMAQGTAISSFDGGTVTISVPYEPEEGTDTSKLVVWYLADDGTISPVEGAYDPATKSFVFKTSHLLTYALVSFPFEDVTAGSWYYGNVAYVFNNNLFNGTSSSTFSPDDTMTRAMLMTVLARMAGQDTAVEDGVWYEKGMNWAVENGISDGTNPEGSITREQLVTMLYRYAGSPEASGDLSAFSDADKVDGYATLAMQWAVGKGLINGMGDGTLAPRDTATRAQVAAILMRFCENIIA